LEADTDTPGGGISEEPRRKEIQERGGDPGQDELQEKRGFYEETRKEGVQEKNPSSGRTVPGLLRSWVPYKAVLCALLRLPDRMNRSDRMNHRKEIL